MFGCFGQLHVGVVQLDMVGVPHSVRDDTINTYGHSPAADGISALPISFGFSCSGLDWVMPEVYLIVIVDHSGTPFRRLDVSNHECGWWVCIHFADVTIKLFTLSRESEEWIVLQFGRFERLAKNTLKCNSTSQHLLNPSLSLLEARDFGYEAVLLFAWKENTKNWILSNKLPYSQRFDCNDEDIWLSTWNDQRLLESWVFFVIRKHLVHKKT